MRIARKEAGHSEQGAEVRGLTPSAEVLDEKQCKDIVLSGCVACLILEKLKNSNDRGELIPKKTLTTYSSFRF